MNKAMTIEELAQFVKEQIKNGNGKKHILLSRDEEGNGYHECFFAFTPTDEFNESDRCLFPYDLSMDEIHKDYIILG